LRFEALKKKTPTPKNQEIGSLRALVGVESSHVYDVRGSSRASKYRKIASARSLSTAQQRGRGRKIVSGPPHAKPSSGVDTGGLKKTQEK